MKVICIDNKPRPTTVPGEPTLTEGKTYTVRRTVIGCTDLRGLSPDIPNCYEIVGFSSVYCFESDRFIPLSNIDEMEVLENERQLVSSN